MKVLLMHNVERIYGNCSLTERACDAVQQSCCCSSEAASLIFYFFSLLLPPHVSCSPGMKQQYITQLLAKSVFFFFHSPSAWPGVFEKWLSDVFLVSVLGPGFIKCSLLPVFAEPRGTFQLVWIFVSVIHLKKCLFCALCGRCGASAEG